MINQRHIVEVPFNLYQGIRVHPAIVLSTNEAIEQEGSFIALMMTTDTTKDEFSFKLENKMLKNRLYVPFCQARLHLISLFHDRDVIRNRNFKNQMKADYFRELVDSICKETFGL